MIRLKKGSVCTKHFLEISPKLGMIMYDAFCFLYRSGHNSDIVVTSLIRPKVNDSGIHAVGCGCDLSNKNIDPELVTLLVEYLNNKYIYDKTRPHMKTCIRHKGSYNGSIAADHLHIQCLPGDYGK